MNLYQFAASMDNERANIYMLSKILGKPVADFDSLRIRNLFKDMEKSLISTALYQERCGLYNIADYRYRKIYSIEEVAVEPKLIPSLYQRCYVKNIKNVMRYH